MNGTGGKPNSESAKRSLTILSQSAIPGLVKPNSESAELDTSMSAKYKQPVYVFLHCAPDSWLLCYPTPICKICPTLKETSGRGVNYLRRQIENRHLWLIQRKTSLAKQTKQKTEKTRKAPTYGWSRGELHLVPPGSLSPQAPLSFAARTAGSRCPEAPGGSTRCGGGGVSPTWMPCLMDKWCNWLVTFRWNRSSTVRKLSTRPSTLEDADMILEISP